MSDPITPSDPHPLWLMLTIASALAGLVSLFLVPAGLILGRSGAVLWGSLTVLTSIPAWARLQRWFRHV